MNPKQKRIVGILVITNVVVILILVALTTRQTPSSRAHIPIPIRPPRPTLPPDDCQWQATQLLAQAGLGGTVMLTTNEALAFEITYPLTPGQTADDAAQETWTAFDIALALHEQGCPSFTRVEVTILAHHSQINVSVSTSDLIAFDADELSQDNFIERVTYTRSTMYDE